MSDTVMRPVKVVQICLAENDLFLLDNKNRVWLKSLYSGADWKQVDLPKVSMKKVVKKARRVPRRKVKKDRK